MAQILTIAPKGQALQVNFHLQETLPQPAANEVLVRFLAVPVNPLDALVIADLYPVKPAYKHSGESIIGYDGVGEVVSHGPDVSTVVKGDLVIPSRFGIGTWRTHGVFDEKSLQKVSRPTDLAFAAILRITVAPAFCLVEDMATLRAGDYIIQNAGTSAVAQFVIQFARRRGVKSINVVRDRSSAEELESVKKRLLALGAAEVLSESELNAELAKPADERRALKGKRIALALDSVFGTSGRSLLKSLSVGATFVQLGFLGGPKGQIAIDPQDLFARQITMKGFRSSAQVGLRSVEEQRTLFNWFVELFNKAELELPALGVQRIEWQPRDIEDSKARLFAAVERLHEGKLGQRKQVIIFG